MANRDMRALEIAAVSDPVAREVMKKVKERYFSPAAGWALYKDFIEMERKKNQ
jgi:hypothetical protein